MRIITCSKYNAHSEPLFKELKLLKLEDIRKLQELKNVYKLVHKQIPRYFNCISVTTICKSSKLDLTTFFLYLSKITSNLPENYLSRSKTTCKNKLLK